MATLCEGHFFSPRPTHAARMFLSRWGFGAFWRDLRKLVLDAVVVSLAASSRLHGVGFALFLLETERILICMVCRDIREKFRSYGFFLLWTLTSGGFLLEFWTGADPGVES